MWSEDEPAVSVDFMEPLTADELWIVETLGKVADRWAGCVGDGPTREPDLAEFFAHVHVLQQAVMAQAAARIYPHLFRLAGATTGKDPSNV
jgi:hypothetical protein